MIGDWRCHQLTIQDKEDILTTAFGNMTVMVKQNCLIEAVFISFGLSQSAVHVNAGNLAPRWNHGIINSPPRRGTAANPFISIEISRQSDNNDKEIVLQIM